MSEIKETFERSVLLANKIYKEEGDCKAFVTRKDEIRGMKIILGALGIGVEYDLYGNGWFIPGTDQPTLVRWSI